MEGRALTNRPPKYPDFHGRLWRRLKALGYPTKAEAARFLKERGCDTRSLYPWLNGERLPKGQNLERLAGSLDTTAPYLVYGSGPETPGKVRRLPQ